MGKPLLVGNVAEFNEAKRKVVAGDSIILRNGTWKDAILSFDAKGKKEAPIWLLAQTRGKGILTGKSSLNLSGYFIEAEGLLFFNCNNQKGAVVEFRTSGNKFAFNSRVSNCVIDNCNPEDRLTESNWIILYGQYNRFDHNDILRKKNLGTTLIVQLNDTLNQNNHHRIDHNYFGSRERGRGGNDESTTGPFFYMDQCTFNECSNTELGFIVKLYGVQYSEVSNSIFSDSGSAGRSVWYENFGWTKHTLDYCDFNVADKITSFYPDIAGKNNLYINPELTKDFVPANPVLQTASNKKKAKGFKILKK